ncbi:MAG: nucleotidyltransferase domain-containing protein [Nanoarchaeota archaeon]
MILEKLKKYLKSEKRENIFDIVIFGSLVKGSLEPRDIDVMVIFLDGSLKERLDSIQEIKSRLKGKIDEAIDIKQCLLKDLFSPEFMARTGILLEGISVFHNKKFCQTLGFESYAIFWYNLKNLTHTQKVKFNYILAGRNQKGIIELLNGKRLASGVVKIPIENSLEFEEVLRNNKVAHNKKNILEEL